ncbi:MAG TPA: hypothetical protein VF788_11130 [Pseudonocardiaceae bacterium]
MPGGNASTFRQETAELVEDAYRMVAPRALLARLDVARSGAPRRA